MTPAAASSNQPEIACNPSVVVTGMGAVTGYGWTAGEFTEGVMSSGACIAPAQRFRADGHRTNLVSEVPAPPRRLADRLGCAKVSGRADQFALAAGWEAVGQAGLSELAARRGDWGRRTGVFFSGSTAGMAEAEEYFFALLEPGARPPLRLTRGHTLNCPGDVVARAFAVQGPVVTVSSACASGSLAFGLALRSLRSQEVDYAIVGGSDALCQLTYAGFNALRAVDCEPCRPFRGDRAGLSLGEGGAALILERAESAMARGARPLAAVLGAGASCDAHHMTAPEPGGAGAAEAIRKALADAGRSADQIDFVNAHGTGTPHNDIAEWAALELVFGSRARSLPLTSTKSAIGHLLGAAGAVEAVATVACLSRGAVHPTWGRGDVDPLIAADLVVGASRELGPGRCALSTNLAFGGANAAVVFADCAGQVA